MGEIAALLTSLCWAINSLFFTSAGKALGSINVNRVRLLISFVLLTITHIVFLGTPLPLHVGFEPWAWLGLSSVVGLIIADSFLVQAFILVGTRITMLVFSSAPVISVLIAWVFLGERLTPITLAGIFLAVAGIAVVILDRKGNGVTPQSTRQYIVGILCAFGGAVGEALGQVFAKRGVIDGLPTVSAVVMRVAVAVSILWLITIIFGRVKQTVKQVSENPKALRNVFLGSLFGPFIGFLLIMTALKMTYVGVASTLSSMAPIFLLPISRWVQKEAIGFRAIAGTIISIAGVAVIFLLG